MKSLVRAVTGGAKRGKSKPKSVTLKHTKTMMTISVPVDSSFGRTERLVELARKLRIVADQLERGDYEID